MQGSGAAGHPTRGWRIDKRELRFLAIDALWIAFIFGTAGAAYRFGVPDVERFFWLSIDLIVVVTLVLRPELIRLALQHWIILSWAGLACLSAIWSLNPSISLYHGLQLLMTILAGFLLALYADRSRILKLLFVALLLAALVSLAENVLRPGQAIGWRGAWEGAFSHKNTLGEMMTLLAVTSLCLFLSGWQRVLAAFGFVLAIGLLIQSHSGTATLSLLAVLAPLPLLLSIRQGSGALSAALGLFFTVMAVVLMLLVVTEFDPLAFALTGLGKDTTLSGRTLLWDFGLDAFLKRPVLGAGFKGFWEGDQATVQNLRFVIQSNLWFFHNNYIEVAVAFGIFGPLLLVAGIWMTTSKLLKTLLVDTDYTALWPPLFMFLIIIVCFTENPLFYNHSFYQFLFAATAACYQPIGASLSGRYP